MTRPPGNEGPPPLKEESGEGLRIEVRADRSPETTDRPPVESAGADIIRPWQFNPLSREAMDRFDAVNRSRAEYVYVSAYPPLGGEPPHYTVIVHLRRPANAGLALRAQDEHAILSCFGWDVANSLADIVGRELGGLPVYPYSPPDAAA